MDKKMVVRQSKGLDEDLVVNVYGTAGQPVMVFASQGRDPEYLEDVGLVDELAEFMDAGVIQLFCVSNIDNETWGGTGDAAERAARQEAYYQAVCDEIVPLVHEVSGTDARPLALGFDLGATHAAIFALRRPDLFQGCMCLSGVYDARRYFGDWMDATLYDNTPCAFLPNMPADHPYVGLYNKRQLLFCTGQEASEAESLRTTREIDANLVRLGVDAWCDYWGGDVSHTWYWWKKQVDYFLPIVLEDVEKTTAEEAAEAAAKKPTTRKRSTTRKPTARKTAAKKVAAEKEPAEKVAEPVEEKVAEPAAEKPVEKATAEKKPAATKKAAAEKTTAAKKPAAKAAAPIAKAEKPATPAKATKAATPVKAEKPAAPAKAVKPAVPAKTEDAPAKAEPAAKKAATSKTTAKKTEAKPAAKAETKAAPAKAADPKAEEPKAAEAEAKPTAKKATAKKSTAKTATTKAATTTKASAKKTAAKAEAPVEPEAAKPASAKTAKSAAAKSTAAKTTKSTTTKTSTTKKRGTSTK